jgi:thiamine pyrophosphokinase
MRGIAFIGGEGPSAQVCGSLAGEGDLTAAADSGLIAAENAGLRPDWVLGDMDSLDDPGRLEKYPPGRVIRYPRDKDYTDTELVLELLWEKCCDEIWIAWGGGGRRDHLFAIRSLFERERSPDRWVTRGATLYCLGAPRDLAVNLKRGSLVSVCPLGEGPWKAESRGLRWPLDGLNWNRGFFGISNLSEEARFSIRALAGRFMVILPREDPGGNF